MNYFEKHHFLLENFEGPLGLLHFLIQKNEISIDEIFISPLTQQYQDKLTQENFLHLDGGAEFIGTTAFLLWLKSKALLPVHEQLETLKELAADPQFEIIHSLLDYCRFKEAAKLLQKREDRQKGLFVRGNEPVPEIKKGLGIGHLTLEDLSHLFQEALNKNSFQKFEIQTERWTIQDKIASIQQLFHTQKKVCLQVLFTSTLSKPELIVTFLAILELMKRGDVQIVKQLDDEEIFITCSAYV